MTDPSEQNSSPAEALEALRGAREAIADRVAEGSWAYDLTYAVLVGVMVASQAAPRPFDAVLLIGSAVVLGLMLRRWQARKGMMLTGLGSRRARWVAIGVGVISAGAIVAGLVARRTFDMPEVALYLAPIAAVAALAASRLWLKVYRAEMRAGA
ncbi:hypothetical protein [Caulobacter mirabilis]|uniref:Uncharacterized protein n=1 Tax=Caulobacter mirabilis TaxID=69666 RepID=A0A2D2AX63_9CAUL|nr:hypothetical protein [Caulobacter mirabilis]ATQ42599.1 hypothetical protein CSW64_09365 [Caulobacter mirabilis]